MMPEIDWNCIWPNTGGRPPAITDDFAGTVDIQNEELKDIVRNSHSGNPASDADQSQVQLADADAVAKAFRKTLTKVRCLNGEQSKTALERLNANGWKQVSK